MVHDIVFVYATKMRVYGKYLRLHIHKKYK